MNPLKEKYLNEVVPAMQKQLNLENPMQSRRSRRSSSTSVWVKLWTTRRPSKPPLPT